MADKITEIEIRLKATSDTTANLKNLDKQVTEVTAKIETLRKEYEKINRGSVLKPHSNAPALKKELADAERYLTVLTKIRQLESTQRRTDLRTLAEIADRGGAGKKQWVTGTSPASLQQLRAAELLGGQNKFDIDDPYTLQAVEAAAKNRAAISKRIRDIELKRAQDEKADLDKIIQLRKQIHVNSARAIASLGGPDLGSGNIVGRDALGRPLTIRPINPGVDAFGNPLTVQQGYRRYEAEQRQRQKQQEADERQRQKQQQRTLTQTDKENEAEFKRLDRERKRRWQAEANRSDYVARMEHKRDSNAATIDEILGRRERKGWVGLFLKPKYTEEEKYMLAHSMGEVRFASQRLEQPEHYLKYAPLVDKALGRGFAGSATGFRQAGGFFKDALRSAANVLGRAGLPLYAASAAGVGYATYKGFAESLHAAGEVESQKLFLQGLYNTFNQFTVGNKTQTPVENFLLSGAKADSLYRDVRRIAVKSPLTTQELFKAYAIGYPFLAKKGVTAEQSLGIVDNVASIGKLLGLRPESFQDDLRALSSGNYRNVQSFQAVGVSRAQFGKLAKMEGSELVNELTKVFAPFNQAIQQYDQTYVGKISRLQDAIFRLGATFGEKLADPMKQNLDAITASIEKLSESGSLDRLSEIFTRIVTTITDFIQVVAQNSDTAETLLKIGLGAKALQVVGGSGVLPAIGGALRTPLVAGGPTLGAYALPLAAIGYGAYSTYQSVAGDSELNRTFLATIGDKIRNTFTGRRIQDEPYHQELNAKTISDFLSPQNQALAKDSPVSRAIAYAGLTRLISENKIQNVLSTSSFLSALRNSTGSEFDNKQFVREFTKQGGLATSRIIDKYASPERMLRYLRADKSLFRYGYNTAKALLDEDGNLNASTLTAEGYRKRAYDIYRQIYAPESGNPFDGYVDTIPKKIVEEIEAVARKIEDGSMSEKIAAGLKSLVNPFLAQFQVAIKAIPQTVTDLSVTRLAPLVTDSSSLYGASARLKGSISDTDFEIQSAQERYSAALAVNDYATANKELSLIKSLGAKKFANLASLNTIEGQIGRNSIVTSQGDPILKVTLDNGQTRIYQGVTKNSYLKSLGLDPAALAGISLATGNELGKELDTQLLTAMAAVGMLTDAKVSKTPRPINPLANPGKLTGEIGGKRVKVLDGEAGGYSLNGLKLAQERVDAMDAQLDKGLSKLGLDNTERTSIVLAAMNNPELAKLIASEQVTDKSTLLNTPNVQKIYSKVKTSNTLKFELSGIEMLQDQRNDANFATNLANQQAQQAAAEYAQQADLRLQKRAFNKDVLNKAFDVFTSQSTYGLDLRILGQGNILTGLSGFDSIPSVERERLSASQEQRRLEFIKNLLPAHLKNLQPTGSNLERLRNQAIANIKARPEYASLLGTFAAENMTASKEAAKFRGTILDLYAASPLNIREALLNQTSDPFFDTPESKTARIEAVGQLALDKLAMQDSQLFNGQYTRAYIQDKAKNGTATPEQVSWLLGFSERDAQRKTIQANMARDKAQVAREYDTSTYMRGYTIFKAGLGSYRGGELAKYAQGISDAEALLNGSVSLGQTQNADIRALDLRTNPDGSLTGAARSALEKFVKSLTKANTVLEANIRLEQDRLNRSSAIAKQYGITGTLPTLYEYRQSQDQFALDALLVGTENDPVARARIIADYYGTNANRLKRDRQQENFANAGEAGFRALIGRGDVVGAITGALGTPALDEALSILRASDEDVWNAMPYGRSVRGMRSDAGITAGSMLGAGLLVNAITSGSSYGSEGAQIGGALGPALFAGLGPWGAAVGMLGGGLLGGLFKKKNTEEDRKRKEWQDRVAQILSSIDKSLRPAPDYFRSYKKEQVMGSASKYLSGRVYNGLNVQLAAGR